MKKIGIRILGCMALLSMVGCGRIEGASVQDLSLIHISEPTRH